jgi:cysteinyl-tRNA synthetase
LEDLIAGHRIELGLNKKNPLDFVLWKKAKPEEPYWESPWGKGRPGWHIECSAMVFKTLGPCIDIHGGGQDLIFPHHENEIAQSEACFEKPLAKFWMHNGFVTINNEKMSKSLKNFWTLRDVLNSVEGRVIRFFLLKSHYRMPINFSLEGLQEAGKALLRLQNTLMLEYPDYPEVFFEKEFQDLEQRFFAALDDDLNTAEAIGVLFDLNKLIHKSKSGLVVLKKWSKILGIQLLEKKEPVLSDDVMALIKQRQKAKKDKQYEEADRIRQVLLEKFQLILQDTKEGIQVLKPDDQWSIQIKDV